MRWIVSSSRALVATAVFSMFFVGLGSAQGVTTGAIAGKVTDPQGQPVAQAAVQVTHRGTGFITSVRTRENG
ncbi:MAG TPA: carboxypeptidase-like regulatory domain-containing protein, partial [Gemmatimonadales bacterium]|nr:carboxypeptidase-like regulatory domain-containing protein [Gemmatimonadales bacterium]